MRYKLSEDELEFLVNIATLYRDDRRPHKDDIPFKVGIETLIEKRYVFIDKSGFVHLKSRGHNLVRKVSNNLLQDQEVVSFLPKDMPDDFCL